MSSSVSSFTPSRKWLPVGRSSEAAASTEGRRIATQEAVPDIPAVIAGERGSLYVNLDSMIEGNLYPAALAGVQVVLKKNADGSVDCYGLP